MGNLDFFEPTRTANFSEEMFQQRQPFHGIFVRMLLLECL